MNPVRGRKDYWELQVDAGRDPLTGKRTRVRRGFSGTRRQAEEALNELLNDVTSGRTSAGSATFGDLLLRWLDNVDDSLSPRTLQGYRRIVHKRLIPAFGNRKLHLLKPSDLDSLYRSLTARGLSAASVRMVHAVASSALNQAVRWEWIKENVADKATPPVVRKAKVTIPEPEQVIALIEAARRSKNPELALFLHLAAVTGARRGELIALRWNNVQSTDCALVLEHSIAQVGKELVEKDTKTHQIRRVGLDEASVELLAERRERGDAFARAAGTTLRDDGFVFSDDPAGQEPWQPDRVTQAFGRLSRSLGLHDIRLHDLRHFAATRLLASGVDVRTVSGRLGHADASTTLGVYAHFLQTADGAAADILGDLVKSKA